MNHLLDCICEPVQHIHWKKERECVCVCVGGGGGWHVYVVYEDTNLYNDMGMT